MNLTDICCNNCPHVVVNTAKPGRDYPLIFDLLSKQNSLVLHSNKTGRIITANISQIHLSTKLGLLQSFSHLLFFGEFGLTLRYCVEHFYVNYFIRTLCILLYES